MCFIHTPADWTVFYTVHILCGLEGGGGGEYESEEMRGHVFHSHARGLDCILYCTYSLEDGVRGGPGVRVRG